MFPFVSVLHHRSAAAGMKRDPDDTGEDSVVLSDEDEAELHRQLVERREAQRRRDFDTADSIRT
jgi:hypothetical protein